MLYNKKKKKKKAKKNSNYLPQPWKNGEKIYQVARRRERDVKS